MNSIHSAVIQYLHQKSGINTVPDRSLAHAYPVLVVSIQQLQATILAGGSQVEHTFHLSVSAIADRNRNQNSILIAAIIPLLFNGIPYIQNNTARTLHPTNIQSKEEEISFDLSLCAPIPSKHLNSSPDIMQNLHLSF